MKKHASLFLLCVLMLGGCTSSEENLQTVETMSTVWLETETESKTVESQVPVQPADTVETEAAAHRTEKETASAETTWPSEEIRTPESTAAAEEVHDSLENVENGMGWG